MKERTITHVNYCYELKYDTMGHKYVYYFHNVEITTEFSKNGFCGKMGGHTVKATLQEIWLK